VNQLTLALIAADHHGCAQRVALLWITAAAPKRPAEVARTGSQDRISVAVVRCSEGGPMNLLLAVIYSRRAQALMLYGTYARPRRPLSNEVFNQRWRYRDITAVNPIT
jgi:hypothetical protein